MYLQTSTVIAFDVRDNVFILLWLRRFVEKEVCSVRYCDRHNTLDDEDKQLTILPMLSYNNIDDSLFHFRWVWRRSLFRKSDC